MAAVAGMSSESLKEQIVRRVLPRVQTPGQYIGGELGAVRKDPQPLRGRFCLAFPDTYSIGMSHHGLQVLYAAVNRRSDWVCERVFAPGRDMESQLRGQGLPLYALESFTPLAEFDLLGFTLQYDLCVTNVLTMLDLGGIPLAAEERTDRHPLVIAGGPCACNPEPMARFIDLFLLGDGEEILPQLCAEWLRLKRAGADRVTALGQLAARLPHVYVPRFYQPQFDPAGQYQGLRPTRSDVPAGIAPAVVADLDAMPLPTAPVVPFVECVQDRLAIEIMRGCPGHCRFCQSTTLKRPLRYRRVETIVQAAIESHRNTGTNEISLLSLSTSDYPKFDELIAELHRELRPRGVSISLPSLRINEQLRTIGQQLTTDRSSGLTLAPEAARDEMRRQLGKNIKNDDLYEGCRSALAHGIQRVKLYFMCGLPGESQADLDGIIEMSEAISRLGKEAGGRYATVVANVSNFVPKPQTPYQWNGMQTRAYFQEVHQYLRRRLRFRQIELKYHDLDTSLLEGVLGRGDRRIGPVIETVWRRGARFDAWNDQFQPELWWQALAEAGIDLEALLHRGYSPQARLPWDHMGIRQGRSYLEREQRRWQAEVCGGSEEGSGDEEGIRD
jgi:radical SAM family uncharacterized protein